MILKEGIVSGNSMGLFERFHRISEKHYNLWALKEFARFQKLREYEENLSVETEPDDLLKKM